MPALRGNVGWIMAQKQATFGTPAVPAIPAAAVPGAYKTALAGGGMSPARAIANLAETDSSRDQGVAYVQNETVGGSPEFYVRDDNLGAWLFAVLGADAATGTTPNFTHTITPANTLPYITVWRDVSDVLWEQYLDCKVSSLTVAASAGQPLTATATVNGRTVTRLATDPSLTPAIPLSSGFAYNYNNATVTLSGSGITTISSFSLTIDNNINPIQTDDVQMYDVVEGQRQVTLDFDMIFTDLNEYNSFHYGTTSGTVVSPNIYQTAAVFQFDNGANNQIKFTLPSIAYTEFPVDVNPGGDPITVAVKAVAQRGGSPVITAALKNQVAVY